MSCRSLSLLVWLISAALLHAQSLEQTKCKKGDIAGSYTCRQLASLLDLSNQITNDWRHLKISNKQKEFSLESSLGVRNLNKIETLDISQIAELSLDPQGFQPFTSLRELNISNCQVELLQANYFNRETKLEVLDASFNNLNKISKEQMRNLPHLLYANFSHNSISEIEENSFADMNSLKYLDLSQNELTNLTLGQCNALQYLNLNDNQLKKLFWYDFRAGYDSLEQLHIASNFINATDGGIFQELKHLRLLNLSHNSLEKIEPNLFLNMERIALLHVDLSFNNINRLFDYQFIVLTKLQILDLSENSITTLGALHFYGLAALRKLYLNSNDISDIKAETFANLTVLDTLDLSSNSLEYLNAEIFGSGMLPRMRKLNLKLNNLKSLHPLGFASLPFLEYISLGNNELKTLDVRMFSPLRRLQKLHLGHNAIEMIDADVLESLNLISELLLDNNKLSFIPEVNASFPFLKKISIEGNPWQCACFNELLEWFNKRNISYIRETSLYFRGQKPLCIMTIVDFCVRDLNLVRQHHIAEQFESVLDDDADQEI